MTLSRQDDSRTRGRVNQKARTRAALMRAAGELMAEGRGPSMPDAAERALVSIATAYRYFASAEELWEETAAFDTQDLMNADDVEAAIDAAGDDVEARLEVMLDFWLSLVFANEVKFRQSAKTSLDRWFAAKDDEGRTSSQRPAMRNHWNEIALRPLRDVHEDHDVDALVEALGFAWGAEPMITALDVLHLSPEAAKHRMKSTAVWILRGGLAEMRAADS